MLHAAGEFAWALIHGIFQADRRQHRTCALALLGGNNTFAHQCGQGHIFQCRKGGKQVMELENKAKRRAPSQREAGVVEAPRLFTLNAIAAIGGTLKEADDVKQRALARARRADQRDELTSVDTQRHTM